MMMRPKRRVGDIRHPAAIQEAIAIAGASMRLWHPSQAQRRANRSFRSHLHLRSTSNPPSNRSTALLPQHPSLSQKMHFAFVHAREQACHVPAKAGAVSAGSAQGLSTAEPELMQRCMKQQARAYFLFACGVYNGAIEERSRDV